MDKQEAKLLVEQCEKELSTQYQTMDDIALYNTEKVLKAFQEVNVTLTNMACSSGYGYEDMGKPKLCALYKEI